MKPIVLALGLFAAITPAAHSQVFINELLTNPPGADSSAVRGLELFELRGTPNLPLTGFYLLSLEGQGTTGRGDINQFFDLNAFSIGANGYLAGVQFNSPYAVNAGANVISNSFTFGWGQVNSPTNSSAGHNSDAAQLDFENSATTILLINAGVGGAPTLSTDLDADDDGNLELPTGWTIFDSIAVSDATGTAPAPGDYSYGAITFRIGTVGSDNQGNVVNVPGAQSSIYVARKGESTGSTADDWMGASLLGTHPNFIITNATDVFYNNLVLPDMNLGGVNPVPEPSTWALLGTGLGGFGLFKLRQRRNARR